jgi:hypothetical protein
LRATLEKEPERMRNVKVVVEQLTGNMEREKQCWEKTNLKHLRERGFDTGLTDYIQEVEKRLAAILWSD